MHDPFAYPLVPYGEGDIMRIRRHGWLYVDKTRFLRRLEEERYVFLTRPQRFGKSLWVSLLECYYDRCWAGRFDATFTGTDIGRNPTEERGRYVTLRFDFSKVRGRLETPERSFESYCHVELQRMLERHPDLFPEALRQRILAPPSIGEKLAELFRYAGDHDVPLYVLIDEYDNFACTVLAYRGPEAYHALIHGGLYRSFFAALKGGAGHSGGGLERLFITGAAPVSLDGVTGGFNIGRNISLEPDFNEMAGFTEPEVQRLVEMYRGHGAFNQDTATALGIMGEWYSGYRFAAGHVNDLYNPGMVLHYLRQSIPNRSVPAVLIDANVRIDYGKLRHLLTEGRSPLPPEARSAPRRTEERRSNDNFAMLHEVIAEEQVTVRVRPGFPLERLADPENFLSLLYFFGLLSFRGGPPGTPRLAIPNQTAKRLMYGVLRDGYRDVGLFRVNLFRVEERLRRMATHGEWRPVFAFLSEAIAQQTGIRDHMTGEKMILGFLAAYLSVPGYFFLRSETELGTGHADLALEPVVAVFPHMRHGYLIELKYRRRSEAIDQPAVATAAEEARAQLTRYLADDRLARQFSGMRFTGLIVVFHGWEMVFCDAVTAAAGVHG